MTLTPLEWWGERERGQRVTREDRLLLLALTEYEAGRCADCGHPRSESMDPANDAHDPDHTARYWGSAFRCFACEAITDAQQAKARSLGENGDQMSALKWVAELAPKGYRPA